MNYQPLPPQAPGKNLLLVTGILFIIFNAFGVLTTPFTLMTMDSWLWLFGGQAMRATWTMLYTFNIMLSAFAVIVGILGIMYCNKTDKASLLLVLAVVTIVSSVIFNIAYTVAILAHSTALGVTNIIGIPIGLVLPILFIIGALKNKNAANTPPMPHHRPY
ncbi:MAG: hypothetical protein FWE34_05205 [Defluviitaleaceae bacterium]|nr:hypothetical protein [Defluviitaleaceae bacterium]